MDKVTLFWFRRDLRLEDNHALFLALQHENVIPIFIFDTSILSKLDKDDARVSFIFQSLEKINEACRKAGSSLQIYDGEPSVIWK